MRVLGFGTYDARAHPRVGILLDGLRAAGHEVEELTVPLGLDTAARVGILRRPHRLGLLGIRLLRCWAVLVSRALRRHRAARPDVVVVGYLGHFDVLLARRLFRGTSIVLDHLISAADTALDRGQNGSVKLRLLRTLDRAAVRAADVVLVDTVEHAELVPPSHRAKALVVPVGAPERWRSARLALAGQPHRSGRLHMCGGLQDGEPAALRVVFFGLFTPLQGAPVVGAALGRLADSGAVTGLMIGSGQDLDAAKAAAAANSSIEWHSWVAPEDLPSMVADADVCLGIFGTSAKALRVVPNKVFQGAAAGCAVITSDTPPQRRLLGESVVYVPPGDPAALAGALAALAADRALLARYRAAATELAEAAFRPHVVVRPLLDRLPSLTAVAR